MAEPEQCGGLKSQFPLTHSIWYDVYIEIKFNKVRKPMLTLKLIF
jgi:hypothetical protein